MTNIRTFKGLRPFLDPLESPYDEFGAGHSSTSISLALGAAFAKKIQNEESHTLAVIGDGGMTAGMAFEALNHAGHQDRELNLLVVFNDNNMSISHNVGALSDFINEFFTGPFYRGIRSGSKKILQPIGQVSQFIKQSEKQVKGLFVPSNFFEQLGFNYSGPVDGHDISSLCSILENLKRAGGLQLLHVITQKGKGLNPAEADPIGYHAINKIEKISEQQREQKSPKKYKFSDIFGNWILAKAEQEKNLVAITPAMCEGSNLVAFAKKYPERYFDVGIAEQHSLTFAAGLAKKGLKPVVAIYSTFLQRAYDQLIHDICLPNLPIVLAVDRAGLVGEDGPTHHGVFDMSFARTLPNISIACPSDETEMCLMLNTAYDIEAPCIVRYPRGAGVQNIPEEYVQESLTYGKARVVQESDSGVALLCFGRCLGLAQKMLEEKNMQLTLVDMRWVKPLDSDCLEKLAENHSQFISYRRP